LSISGKIEKTDRYKRTALTHAAMNGAANVVSYLLARGADPNRADTSSQ
jgi:ankyrin repeat protein